MKNKIKEYELRINKYGFIWGDVLVERIASNNRPPYFQVIRIHGIDGCGVDIICRPRSTTAIKFGKEKIKNS